MTFLKSRRNRAHLPLAVSLALSLSAASAAAQQVTYYNFNTPATASPLQYSYGCTPNSASNPLFCFNFPVGPTATGTTQNPIFIQDPSPNYAVQMTHPQASQDASMWFSLPQNVANGFNVWFQFRITPSDSAYATADGLAFVIQNALSGGFDATGGCTANGQGPTALGGGGGCMGYGGIPNSVALEFDTYNNQPWDSADYGSGSNYANHIALQSCGLNGGAPLPNSPTHEGAGNCLVSLGGTVSTLVSNPQTSGTSPSNSTAVTLADGNVHNVVIVYNGPLESSPNTISVYLDPQFNEGTFTPVAGSQPVFTGPFDITQYMNLTNGSAYIGFTSGTGSAFETHEVLGWTFTPHSTVSQTQPLNPPGTPTTFDFGTHSYTTNFPPSTNTNDITMGLIANTITPQQFSTLMGLGPAQYSGSQCQVYDDTGGNCIIYSAYCFYTDTKAPTACPAPETPPSDCSNPAATDCIDLTSAYNNSVQPTSPGYLQGDPLFSPIQSVSTSSGTGTVTCLGECAVTPNQIVAILDTNDNPIATVTVATVPAANTFTFTTTATINQTGGFLTSNNVQDIFISYNPQNIDGSTTGHAKNFSDFVVTAVTNTGGTMQLAGANNNTAIVGQPEVLTSTITIPATVAENGIPTNQLTLLPGGSPGLTPTGTINFYQGTDTSGTPICTSGLTLNSGSYQATCSFTATATGPQTITATYSGDPFHVIGMQSVVLTVNAASTVKISPSSMDFGTLYLGRIVTKIVTLQNIGTTPLTVTDPLIAIVQGGNSNEFITLNLCPKSLAVGRTCYMTVTFLAGPFYTPQTAVLTIKDSSPDSPQTIPLSATVINPRVGLSARSLNFGTHKVGSSTTTSLRITNIGGTPLSFSSITVGGADPLDFSVGTCPATLPAGGSCMLSVTFTPKATRGRTAILTIRDNAQDSPQSVSLSGAGN